MDHRGDRPDDSCWRALVPHKRGVNDGRFRHSDYEAGGEHEGPNAEHDHLRRVGHDGPPEHVAPRPSRSESQTEADDPARHDEPTQQPRSVLKNGSRPHLGRLRRRCIELELARVREVCSAEIVPSANLGSHGDPVCPRRHHANRSDRGNWPGHREPKREVVVCSRRCSGWGFMLGRGGRGRRRTSPATLV
ncbi:MAG: hypothetical protein QOK06_494 [Acidimicrobiaceae bacterium]